MFKRLRSFILALFLLVILLLTCQQSFAGMNIPSKAEISYAKGLYVLITDFDKKETAFAKNHTGSVSSNSTQILAAFEGKFNYTKDFYLKVLKLQPSSKFIECHNELLEGIYTNLQYLKIITNGLKKGENIHSLTHKHSTTFALAMNKYQTAVKTFSAIVKSWQKPYIKEVLPPNYLPDNNK